VKHRTGRWAAVTAKQNDAVTLVTTVTDPLEECAPKNRILIRILPVVEKEESEAIASGI
jgi:hypothetical protein